MFRFIDQLQQLVEDKEWTLHSMTAGGDFSYSVEFSVPSRDHECLYLVTILISVNGVTMSLSSGVDASSWVGLYPLLKDLFISRNGMMQGRGANGTFSLTTVIEMEPGMEDVVEFVAAATQSADLLITAIKAAQKAVADVCR